MSISKNEIIKQYGYYLHDKKVTILDALKTISVDDPAVSGYLKVLKHIFEAECLMLEIW